MSKFLLGPLNVLKWITFDPLQLNILSLHIFSVMPRLKQLAAPVVPADLGSEAVVDVLNSTSIWPQTSTSNPTQRLAGACQLTLSITCHAHKEPWPAEWQDGALPIRTLKRRTSNNLGSRHNLGRATHHHILIEHVASLLLSCVQIAIVNSVQLSIYKWGSITQALAVAYVRERCLSLLALPDSWL